MMDRIIIGLDGQVAPQQATATLRELGASSVEPIEGIPDALVAYVDSARAEDFISRALQSPGIRHAEHDQLRSTY